MYLTVNGHDHEVPMAFGQALANFASANFHYGVGIGQNNRRLDSEREAMHATEGALLHQIENLLTLFSQGKLHRSGVPDHDAVGTSRATNQSPALSEWAWE